MRIRNLLLVAPAAFRVACPAAAAASDYAPGEVLVKYQDGTTAAQRSEILSDTGTRTEDRLASGTRRLEIRDGDSVARTVDELNADPKVAYAVPNYVAHAAALYPNDPGFKLQWNFSGEFGIHMPEAWSLARHLRRPGGRGAVVAILDTGVAYRRTRRFRRAPDLKNFTRSKYDFVSHDRFPDDGNGHGTHVAGTVGETVNNRRGATGVAYRAKIMPVRVLDSEGEGTTDKISAGIRFAARRHVDVINLSMEFDRSVHASDIPDVTSAIRYARRKGVVLVGATGNEGDPEVAYPARARGVIAVAATTNRGCQAEYSNEGPEVDLAAPGGGEDASNQDNPWDAAHCRPTEGGRWIYQQTYTTSVRRFGLPSGYEGTSMSAPHVAGIVALLKASRRIGRHPSPRAVEARLKATARDLGPPGHDLRYGAGLVDAAAALR